MHMSNRITIQRERSESESKSESAADDLQLIVNWSRLVDRTPAGMHMNTRDRRDKADNDVAAANNAMQNAMLQRYSYS